MNITVISSDYPYEGHQSYIFVEQLVKSIVDLGHTVNVIAPQNLLKSLLGKQPMVAKYALHETNAHAQYAVYRPYFISLGMRFRFLSPLLNYIRGKSIERVANKLKTDVLYAHFWENVLLIEPYVRKKKLPLFVACGEGDNALEEMVETLGNERVKELKSMMTGVISVSSENKRKCLDFNLIDKDRIIIEPNCVDTSIFHRQDVGAMKKELGIVEGDFVIAFVGGFIPRKGPDRLASAITKLNDKKIKSIFIGREFPGYDYSFDCEGIIFRGTAKHDDIPLLLNCADIFVLPTQKEGCCNSIVEALACGLPVVSSDGSFNDDILDAENSIRIDVDDVDAIAEAISNLKNNIELRRSMSKISIERHTRYTIEDRAKRIVAFIEKMTKKTC